VIVETDGEHGLNLQKHIFSIKEITRTIKAKLESESGLQNVWVRGEISNFTRHSSGHLYFTLKDKDSRIKCVMFAGQASRLAFNPKDGSNVIANGNVTVYERDGQYQLYVSSMEPDGIGNLFLAFEQLKRKLEQEGLFASERKRPIPAFPKAIGVITSPTGAAVRDIVTTLQRRNPAVEIIIFPVSVQGTVAAPSIVSAIRWMNKRREVDLLIVGRGGGSLEELWAFNEELVARAIVASELPIISAVGHETDFTIADFVADLRAATPTAAAELAVPHRLELLQSIGHFRQRLLVIMRSALIAKREQLARLKRSPYLTSPRKQLMNQQLERLDRHTAALTIHTKANLRAAKDRLNQLERRLLLKNPIEYVKHFAQEMIMIQLNLQQTMRERMQQHHHRLQLQMQRLDALSPLKVMHRGYSLAYDQQQRLITTVHQVQPGEPLRVRLVDGQLDCRVEAKRGE